jgi:hypothetical protein
MTPTEQINQSADNQEIPEAIEGEQPETGQEDETGSPESEETQVTEQGEGLEKKADRGLPKDYKGLHAEFTKKSQELSTATRKLEFYQSMMDDPDIASIVKAKIEQARTGVKPAPQYTRPEAETSEEAVDYEKMTPNEVIAKLSEQITAKVWKQFENMYNAQAKPVLDSVLAEKAENQIQQFFAKNPEAQQYRKEIGELMLARSGTTMEEAWKIINYDNIVENAPKKAKEQLEDEITLKKKSNLLTTSGGSTTTKLKEKPTAREAMESAFAQYGE